MLAGNIVGVALIRVAMASATGYTLKQRPLKRLLAQSLTALVDDNGGKTDAPGQD